MSIIQVEYIVVMHTHLVYLLPILLTWVVGALDSGYACGLLRVTSEPASVYHPCTYTDESFVCEFCFHFLSPIIFIFPNPYFVYDVSFRALHVRYVVVHVLFVVEHSGIPPATGLATHGIAPVLAVKL
jgi:hypothetical protein